MFAVSTELWDFTKKNDYQISLRIGVFFVNREGMGLNVFHF